MKRVLKIGTRDSELALWQANTVKEKLTEIGFSVKLIPVKSTGDLLLHKPLYELGITGIFTKTLDTALLNNTIDIAVHSLKDVPTLLPKGIVQTAVLKRATTLDVLVYTGKPDYTTSCTIATGSLRRKAQWLHKYPHHTITNLRGNVNSRLQKLNNNNWDGAIFAKAGLERINLLPENHIDLNWMIPAPAQGAMVVTARKNDSFSIEASQKLNHFHSEVCTYIERQFLQTLEGGCTAPIGAHAKILQNGEVNFTGALFSLNGRKKITVSENIHLSQYLDFGKNCALEVLKNGGTQLMKEIKDELQS